MHDREGERVSTIIITTRFGPQPMEAIWEQGGLAVHPTFFRGTESVIDEGWTVTHVRSGCRIRQDLARDEAVVLAEALLPCGDWTRDFAATVADDELYAAVRKVARTRGWRLPSKRVADAQRAAALARFA